VLIRHLWQLKSAVFLHRCLICTVLLHGCALLEHSTEIKVLNVATGIREKWQKTNFYWQSLLQNHQLNCPRQQQRLLALATLGDANPIRLPLFVLHHPMFPRQVIAVAVAGIFQNNFSTVFANLSIILQFSFSCKYLC